NEFVIVQFAQNDVVFFVRHDKSFRSDGTGRFSHMGGLTQTDIAICDMGDAVGDQTGRIVIIVTRFSRLTRGMGWLMFPLCSILAR
ncbi:MAG: hypothetical protein AAFN51_00540, partial [Pseudomonadota bacterium]